MDYTALLSLGGQAADVGSLLLGAFGGASQEEQLAQVEGNIAELNAETQGYFAKLEAEGVAKAAELNALLAEQDAGIVEKFGLVKAEEAIRAGQRALGSQVAAYAAAGVSVVEGSPLEVYGNTIYEADKQARNELYNAATTAKRIRLEAQLGIIQAQQATRMAQLNADNLARTASAKAGTASSLAQQRGKSGITNALIQSASAVPSLLAGAQDVYESISPSYDAADNLL